MTDAKINWKFSQLVEFRKFYYLVYKWLLLCIITWRHCNCCSLPKIRKSKSWHKLIDSRCVFKFISRKLQTCFPSIWYASSSFKFFEPSHTSWNYQGRKTQRLSNFNCFIHLLITVSRDSSQVSHHFSRSDLILMHFSITISLMLRRHVERTFLCVVRMRLTHFPLVFFLSSNSRSSQTLRVSYTSRNWLGVTHKPHSNVWNQSNSENWTRVITHHHWDIQTAIGPFHFEHYPVLSLRRCQSP